MRNIIVYSTLWIIISAGCNADKKPSILTDRDKIFIQTAIQNEIDVLIRAVNNKDIDTYMDKMPEDFIIYDVNGEMITRTQQREYALRDWSIIERTLQNEMKIDSIDIITSDSVYVFTDQRWERIMYQRDGITTDTVITTQRHRELWKNKQNGWVGYDVEELGGDIYINGNKYNSN